MARLGMDVDTVEAAGRRLQRQGDYLANVARTIDALVGQAGSLWDGNVGRRFVDEWRSHHRAVLLNAGHAVRGLGTSALNNAAEQRRVSGQGLKGSAGSVPVRGPDALQSLRNYLGWTTQSMEQNHFSTGLKAAELLAWMGSNAALIGRYSGRYHSFANAISKLTAGKVTFDNLRYKTLLNGPFTVNGPLDVLVKSPLFKTFSRFQSGVSIANHVADVFAPRASLEDRVLAGADGTAAALKTGGGVSYLGGVAVSSWTMAAREAQKVDFSSEGIQMVKDEIARDPSILVTELGHATVEVFTKKIWSIF
jgi:hypothetical protein